MTELTINKRSSWDTNRTMFTYAVEGIFVTIMKGDEGENWTLHVPVLGLNYQDTFIPMDDRFDLEWVKGITLNMVRTRMNHICNAMEELL